MILDTVTITPSVPSAFGQTRLTPFMDGSMLVTDPQARTVHVTDGAGQRQRSIPSGSAVDPRLRSPTSARLTPDGDVLVSDSGRAILFHLDDSPANPAKILPVTVSAIDAWALGDDRYLLRGIQAGDDRRHVLHLWNAESHADQHFFPWPAFQDLSVHIGGLDLFDAVLQDDTVWTVYAFSDTVYGFDVGGEQPSRVNQVSIPLMGPLGAPGHEHGSQDHPTPDADLMQLTDLFLLEDGDFAVQMLRRARDTGRLHWGLTILNRSGETLFQQIAGPQLMMVSDGIFHFADETADHRLRLIVARRR